MEYIYHFQISIPLEDQYGNNLQLCQGFCSDLLLEHNCNPHAEHGPHASIQIIPLSSFAMSCVRIEGKYMMLEGLNNANTLPGPREVTDT